MATVTAAGSAQGVHEARYWTAESGGRVSCQLCAHMCKNIAEGKTGICGVRKNIGGKLFSMVWGMTTGGAIDPIEKKPLYHFRPGTNVLSFGTVGCNLKCMHCQNYSTSHAGPDSQFLSRLSLEDIPKLAASYDCAGVAWTYNEPTVWYEFTLEGSILAKKHGLYTCYVSNGFINEAPLREIAPHLDAVNIDVKGFTDEFYTGVCKAKLAPVLGSCVLAKKLGIHLEITYLVIPGKNDTQEQFEGFAKWVTDSLGKDVPVHFSRFHPDYKMQDIPATPVSTLKEAYGAAKRAGIEFVYIGNVHGADDSTYCPGCRELLIQRHGMFDSVVRVSGGTCPKCGRKVNIIQ